MKAKSMMRKSRIGIMFSVAVVVAAIVLCMGCNGKEQTSGTAGNAAETIDTGAEIKETEADEIVEDETDIAEEETGQEEASVKEEADIAEEETGQEEASAEEEAAAVNNGPYADEIAAIAAASVGDIVYFGSYEQDNDTTNGTEPVAWYVLDKSGGEATLLAVYLLDCQPYHEDWEDDITWEECTLRSWLNSDFYNTAFVGEERAVIVNTNVVNEDNPCYSGQGGNDTADKVWLLSLGEIERYFHIGRSVCDAYANETMSWYEYAIYCYGQDNRVCAKPTAYAEARGVYTYSEEYAQIWMKDGCDMSYAIGSGWWSLRLPGHSNNLVAYVDKDGGVDFHGGNMGTYYGVRPALKVAY